MASLPTTSPAFPTYPHQHQLPPYKYAASTQLAYPLPSTAPIVYAAAWLAESTVANAGRAAPATPLPVLLYSANVTWSVFGVLVDHCDQSALFICGAVSARRGGGGGGVRGR